MSAWELFIVVAGAACGTVVGIAISVILNLGAEVLMRRWRLRRLRMP